MMGESTKMFTVTPFAWQSPGGHDQYYKKVQEINSAKIEGITYA